MLAPADGSIGPVKLSQPFTRATEVASTSGTAIDFTEIPSWVRRITIMFDGVSGSGTSVPIIQLGDSGGFETTSYSGGASNQAGGYTANTVGFVINVSNAAASVHSGHAFLTNISGNKWVFSSSIQIASANIGIGAGVKTLSDVLDRIRISFVNGTDTFDLGAVNIMYEG